MLSLLFAAAYLAAIYLCFFMANTSKAKASKAVAAKKDSPSPPEKEAGKPPPENDDDYEMASMVSSSPKSNAVYDKAKKASPSPPPEKKAVEPPAENVDYEIVSSSSLVSSSSRGDIACDIAYEIAKKEFDDLHIYDYDTALEWFTKRGHGDKFQTYFDETYFEAKEFCETPEKKASKPSVSFPENYEMVSMFPRTPDNDAAYEIAKKEFYRLHIDDYHTALAWFTKRGHGDKFQTYFEAKEFYETKGCYLKPSDLDKDVYHDVLTALFQSEFIYCLGQLRQTIKSLGFTAEELEKEVVFGESFPTLKSKEPMVQLLMGNLKVSKDINVKSPEIKIEQIEDVLRYREFDEIQRFSTELMVTAMMNMKAQKTFLHKFDAAYSTVNLVYSISGRERGCGNYPGWTDLFLTFRGSTTLRDWFQNSRHPMTELKLRKDTHTERCYLIEGTTFEKIEIESALYQQFLTIEKEVGEPIFVHNGFLQYLFADRGEDGLIDDDKDSDSMYHNIRLNLLRLLENKHTTTNRIYVTGHSLGGALCSLASFFLACDKSMNNWSSDWRGINCISFASPQVGNISFQRAIEVLHSPKHYQSASTAAAAIPYGRRLLQVFRFTNSRDPVPQGVFWSTYRQTPGIHVHLNRPSLRTLWKPRKPRKEVMAAHWICEFNIHHPWKMFRPTSIGGGIFTNSYKLLRFITTTFPAVFLFPFLLLKPLFAAMQPALEVQHALLDLSRFVPKVFHIPLASVLYHPWFYQGVLLIKGFHLLIKKNSSSLERLGLVSAILFCLNQATKDCQSKVIEKLVLAQVVMYFLRRPVPDVLPSFYVHSMGWGCGDYYSNLKPHHKKLSSTLTLLKDVNLEEIDNNGNWEEPSMSRASLRVLRSSIVGHTGSNLRAMRRSIVGRTGSKAKSD